MIPFAVIAVAMLAVAIAWLVVPLLHRRGTTVLEREASNVALLRDQADELDADVRSGTLSAEGREQAQRELEERVLQEALPLHASRAVVPGAGRKTVWTIAALMPVAAIALYALWGNFTAFAPQAPVAAKGPGTMTAAEIEPLIAKVIARLEQEPDNAQGWIVLARTYYAINRYAEAAQAFERAVRLVPGDATLLADYADALGAARQSLQGKPAELVARALAIEPRNWKALALAGTASFDRQDYRQALVHWEALKAIVPADAPLAQSIDASIAEARQLGAFAPAPPGGSGAFVAAPDTARPAAPPAGGSAVAGTAVAGTISLDPKLTAQARPDDTVFIFARAADGPRMPLAILKRQAKDLPLRFKLDDSMAMAPNATLSSAAQVVVGARITKSGAALPQSGDLEGYSAAIKPGATSVDVVIDRVVP
ncbi:MAG: c-type cytochrome biogenesis protein CcmI [Casimicrobiaceae bacterium]